MLVVPASMTLAATSSNEVVSLGYIVVIDSERLTSSMLLMLEESTVTWISTGLPSNRIEAVYTPGQNLGASALSRGVSILEEAEAFTVLLLGLVVFLELSELLLPRRITANIIKAIIIAAITTPIRSFFKWNNNNFSLTHHKETCPSYSLLQNIWYGVGDYD